jgi:hypothetical protein
MKRQWHDGLCLYENVMLVLKMCAPACLHACMHVFGWSSPVSHLKNSRTSSLCALS